MVNEIPRRSRRKWPMVVIVFALVLAGSLVAANWWLNSDDVAGRIERTLSANTGLAATIGDVDFKLLPIPALVLEGVSIGEGDFRAEVASAAAYLDWASVTRGVAIIHRIQVDSAHLFVPEDVVELERRVAELTAVLREGTTTAPQGATNLQVDRIELANAAVYRGETREARAFGLDGAVSKAYPLEAGLEGAFEGTVEFLGSACLFTLTLDQKGGEHEVALDIAGIEVEKLVGAPLPISTMRAHVVAQGPSYAPADLFWHVEGAAESGSHEMALGGAFSAQGGFDGDLVVINDFLWAGDGFTVRADATRYPENKWAIQIPEARFGATALRVVAARAEDTAVRVHVDEDAALSGENLFFAVDLSGNFEFDSGTVRLAGLALSNATGEPVLDAIQAEAELKDGRITATASAGEALQMNGTIVPDLDNQSLRSEWSGLMRVTPASFNAIADVSELQDVAGVIKLDHAVVSMTRASGLVNAEYRGAIVDGTLTVDADDDFFETFSSINGAFEGDAESVRADVNTVAATMGPIHAVATVPFDAFRIDAIAEGDASKLAKQIYWGPEAEENLAAVFEGFGQVRVEGVVHLPKGEQKRVLVEAAVANPPGGRTLAGEFLWEALGGGRGYGLKRIHVDGKVPATGLAGYAPELEPTGMARVTVDRYANTPRFAVNIDLAEAGLTYENVLRKEPGLPASVAIEGATGAPGWKPERFRVSLLEETYVGVYEGDAVRFQDARIDLAAFTPLYMGERKASGLVILSLLTEPLNLEALFEDVKVQLAPTAEIEALDGQLAWSNGAWRTDGLAVKGGGSDFQVRGDYSANTWTGSIEGGRLDIQNILRLVDAATADTENDTEAGEEASSADSSIVRASATAEVSFGEVIYGPAASDHPARFTDFTANLRWNENGLQVENIAASAYGGTLSGAIAWRTAEPTSSLALELDFRSVGAAVFDDALFVNGRQLAGAVSGPIRVSFPLQGESAFLNGLTGRADLSAVDGTLGKVGMATQLLTVLAGLQIWQIHRFPGGDQGLFYDTLSVAAVAENGIVQLNQLQLKNPYLEVQAQGQLDFPANSSNIGIDVNVLEGILRPLNPIPIVGQATSRLGVIKLQSTGPPDDPKMGIVSVVGFKGLSEGIKDAGGTARDVLEKEVLDRVVDAIGGLLGNRGG